MIISNPTAQDITVQISGTTYTVKANDELRGISAEAADYWKSNLHSFLEVRDEVAKVQKEKVEEVIEKVKAK